MRGASVVNTEKPRFSKGTKIILLRSSFLCITLMAVSMSYLHGTPSNSAKLGSMLSTTTATALDNQVDAVESQVDTLSDKVQDLTVDQAAAFDKLQNDIQSLKDQTNLSKGVLLVGGILLNSPGLTFDWPVSLVPGTFLPSGLQVDAVLPPGFSIVSITAGPAATAAGKQVSVSGNRFILFGLNQTTIGPGIIATVRLQVTPATAKRQYSIGLISPVVSDKNGNSVLVSAISGVVEVL